MWVPPILRWLRGYDARRDLLRDCGAALGVLLIGVPEAIAFAAIAGLPPASGLYSTLVAPIVYGALGGSPCVVLGPTSLVSILTAVALPEAWGGRALAPESPELAAVAGALALTVGGAMLLLRALRAHALVRLVSEPLLAGFVTGLALLVASTQFAALLGLPRCAPASGGGACTFAEAAVSALAGARGVRWAPPAAALASLALLLSWKLLLPRVLPARLAPVKFLGPLVLLVAALAAVAAVGSEAVAAAGIALVEPIPAGLPSAAWALPAASAADAGHLLGGALPLAIIGYIELVSVGASAARAQRGAEVPPPAAELLALAAANLACGLARGYPVTASVSRTAVALDLQAASPVASLLAGVAVLPVLLAATPALALLPRVVTAAMVLAVLPRLLALRYGARLARSDARDAVVFFSALAGTLLLEVSLGFAVGLGVAWVAALTRGEGRARVRLVHAADPRTALQALPPGEGGAGGAAAGEAAAVAVVVGSANPLHLGSKVGEWGAGGSSGSSSSSSGSSSSSSGSSSSAASAASAASAPLCARRPVLVHLQPGSPDLQFHAIAACAEAVREAAACYTPLAIVLDLARCASADSGTCGALAGLGRELREGGTALWLAGGARGVLALLEAGGLVEVGAGGGAGAGAGAGAGGGLLLPWAATVELALAAAAGAGSAAAAPAPAAPEHVFSVPPSARERQALARRRAQEPFCEAAEAGEAEAREGLWAWARRLASGRGGTAPLLERAE